MNKATSIKDIGNIYLEMQRLNGNLLNESIKKTNKVKAKMPKNTFPLAGSEVKEPSTIKKSGPKNVKGLSKAKKDKKNSQKTKKITESEINNFMSIFDKLYENVMNNDELDINTGIGAGPEGESGDDFDFGGESSDSSDDSNEVTITLDKDLAQKLHDVLMGVLGDDDQVEDELKDLGVNSDDSDEDCEDEDELSETTEMEKVSDSSGHKLTKHGTVGNIKASSGKASNQVTDKTGTETKGHPMDHKSELSNPSKNKVGGLKTGKSLFDQ
jgi:hypothetical protein